MAKEWLKGFLSTTALTLIIISLYAWVTGDSSVSLLSILPSVAANLIIHLGLLGVRQIALENLLVEISVEIIFVLAVVLGIGYLVGWFQAFNVWITVAITLVVFALACALNIRRLNRDLDVINREIDLLKGKGIDAS